MTILHVTDLHFHKPWFNWLAAHAPDHDLLVMSGDLLDLSAATSRRNQIEWVSAWINGYPRPICVCSGIHDLEWDDRAERWMPAYWLRAFANPTVWTDGQRVTLNDVSLLNISCTSHPKGSPADIWVVHAPPAETLVAMRTDGRDAGDPDLAVPIRRHAPRAVLSGHVHDPVRWWDRVESTLYLNPGSRPDAAFPNHILLQTHDLSGQFISAWKHEVLMPFEAFQLDAVTTDVGAATALA